MNETYMPEYETNAAVETEMTAETAANAGLNDEGYDNAYADDYDNAYDHSYDSAEAEPAAERHDLMAADGAAETEPAAEPVAAPVMQRNAPNGAMLEHIAGQLRYINDATGINMLTVLRGAPELMRGVAEYVAGDGGFDAIGAYDRYRRALAAPRARVPASDAVAGGGEGGGRLDVNRLTDDMIDDIDRRCRQGERIVL